MKNKTMKVCIVLSLTSLLACSQTNETPIEQATPVADQKVERTHKAPHSYGGWYCPDNLFGFPAVDIADWKSVPVVNGRMPTEEETRNGTSLILVDTEEYPNAKPLDMTLPKLARYYNESSKREELVIVIQALNVSNDSIVGFRFLNGGNGSAWFDEVHFLTDDEIGKIPDTHFFTTTIEINTPASVVGKVLTQPEYAESLHQIVDDGSPVKTTWPKSLNVNFHYPNSGALTSTFAGDMYGNFYIQNDYDARNYTEKFFPFENHETKRTELRIVCGPFGDDFETQSAILEAWAQKVKELSEAKWW